MNGGIPNEEKENIRKKGSKAACFHPPANRGKSGYRLQSGHLWAGGTGLFYCEAIQHLCAFRSKYRRKNLCTDDRVEGCGGD